MRDNRSLRVLATLCLLVLFSGCASNQAKMAEEAANVPRLTKVMHVHVRHLNLPADGVLSQEQVRQVYSETLASNPSLALLEEQSLTVKWSSGEITLLILDGRTGAACFEDTSCTPKLDQRWYEFPHPPTTFTISHPQTCGCRQLDLKQKKEFSTSP